MTPETIKTEKATVDKTVAETVAEKFTQLPTSGKAYVLGYLMGKEAERNDEASRSA